MEQEKKLNVKWLVLMAWRDSRRNRSRLFLFMSSIVLGIAALVAIYSLSYNVNREINQQAASLIGADLDISSGKPYTPSIQKLIDSLGERRSEEKRFSSMIYFPKSGGSRLIEVRALGGDFPYYGKLETEPSSAGVDFRNGEKALVDQTLMLQFNAHVGDSIHIGTSGFIISGTLMSAPGQTGIQSAVAPIVYIPIAALPQTGLEQKGSRINYRYHIKWDKPVDMTAVENKIKKPFDLEGINWDTIETQKQNTARSFSDLTRFLSLVGFIALLLGCIGVASAIQIYIREKINTIAILRCLGTTSSQAFLIYLIQIICIGFLGSAAGALLGTGIEQLLPAVVKDWLPITISTVVSWQAIAQGIMLGVIISVLFALLPLVSIRKISPLHTLRISFESVSSGDAVKWLVYFLMLVFVVVFSYVQLGDWVQAFVFTIALCVALLILTGIAALLMGLVRKFFPSSWSYLLRQGIANLYRPNNQTRILIVSIGLGTALICTLFFMQSLLLSRVSLATSGNQPNMVLFDIQSSQREPLMALAREQGLPVTGTIPIVTMRLEAINNITPKVLLKDTSLPMQRWVFRREYRVTFRDSLTSTEKIKKGAWTGNAKEGDLIPVSLEERFAERNGIKVGDTMHFNVQGALLTTLVGSLREVNWGRLQTNFLVLFPKGVLEEAPQFHVLFTKVPSAKVSAHFQQAVVQQFPNVSIIDLQLVLNILDNLLSKIGFVIRFMAAFSMITGLVVLIASVVISKYQRIQENVLLRTLGAKSKQIFMITAIEYLMLGAMAAATGILLALAAGWALAKYSFEIAFTPPLFSVVVVFVSICFLTVVIGVFNSRSALNKSPLEILRQEV